MALILPGTAQVHKGGGVKLGALHTSAGAHTHNLKEREMLKEMLVVVALSVIATTSAFASDEARAAAREVIELKDGSTVYIFKDGKMAMEDKYGRATRMKKETVMEAKDGRKIIMHGDEVMRLDSLLRHGNGS